MDDINVKDVSSLDLVEVYKNLLDFLLFLEKEKNTVIKMGEENE